jgi:hypothetical protein
MNNKLAGDLIFWFERVYIGASTDTSGMPDTSVACCSYLAYATTINYLSMIPTPSTRRPNTILYQEYQQQPTMENIFTRMFLYHFGYVENN